MKKIRKDITGKRFGRLIVLGVGSREIGRIMWRCVCDCGTEKEIEGTKLRTGWTVSCGCYHKERVLKAMTKHGHGGTNREKRKSPEYTTWANIRSRCNNPNVEGYEDYGGRGIKVCPEWDCRGGFIPFLAHIGAKPSPLHSIDRINHNGNYEAGNVRWILLEDQAKNTRANRNFTHDGKTMCAAAWDRALGFKKGTVLRRIDVCDWSVHKALSTPLLSGAPRASEYNRSPGCANQEADKIDPRWWLAD